MKFLQQHSHMIIDKKQYISNTIRPSRSQSFLSDLKNSYSVFVRFNQPYKLTIQQFDTYIWSSPPQIPKLIKGSKSRNNYIVTSFPHNTLRMEQQIHRYVDDNAMDEQIGREFQHTKKEYTHSKIEVNQCLLNQAKPKYSSIKFLANCRSEQEDKQQYYQLLFQVIIDHFFGSYQDNLDKNSKVYCLFLLYFFSFANSDFYKKKSLNVSPDFVSHLTRFLKQNKADSYLTYFKIAKKLFQNCFQFGIKVGLKNSVLNLSNPINRQHYTSNCISKQLKISQFMNNLGDHISLFQTQINQYQDLKRNLMKQDTQFYQYLQQNKKTDYILPQRIKILMNNYHNQFAKMQRR